MSEILRPYTGDKRYIFISYAHKDMTAVMAILEQMNLHGYRIWFDEGIDPGTEWDENIASHVEACDSFIAFITEGYIASENCKDELNYARDLNKNRLLVYLEDVSLPRGMAMRLNRLQAIFRHKYQQESDFYEKLFAVPMLLCCKENVKSFMDEQLDSMDEEILIKHLVDDDSTNDDFALDTLLIAYDNVDDMYVSLSDYQELKIKAKVGNMKAQFLLGILYYYGNENLGIRVNYSNCVKWILLAAEQGYAKAQSFLGYMYDPSYYHFDEDSLVKAIPRNVSKAIKWYRKAAEKGDIDAQYNLGIHYEQGEGVPQDYSEAVKWYQLPAEKGYDGAQYSLGYCYEMGLGVSQDFDKAVYWYSKAAENLNMKAKTALNRLS